MATLSATATQLESVARDAANLMGTVNRSIQDIRDHLEEGGDDAQVTLTNELSDYNSGAGTVRSAIKSAKTKIATAIENA